MLSLGRMSPAVQEVATDIDLIGWTDFLHGRVPRSLRRFQTSHCASIGCRMTGADWMKAFVTRLLNITHGQWMYRNFSLHSKARGHLQLTRQANILTEIATLAESKPKDIPPESRFLLEVEIINLDSKSTAHQEYWINAMKAAIKAGGRRPTRRHRTTTNNPTPLGATVTPTSATQRRNLHRFRRRIASLEKKLIEDLDLQYGSWRRNKRPLSTPNDAHNGSNKRFRKPD